MTRRLAASLGAALVLALSFAAGALAAGGTSVEITVTGDNNVETFVTTGGVLCASGDSENTFQGFGGSFMSRAGSFHGYKTLTCDGSGEQFVITYDAAAVFGSPQDQGGWHFVEGTGPYASCVGGGNLVGYYTETGIVDHYTGTLNC